MLIEDAIAAEALVADGAGESSHLCPPQEEEQHEAEGEAAPGEERQGDGCREHEGEDGEGEEQHALHRATLALVGVPEQGVGPW